MELREEVERATGLPVKMVADIEGCTRRELYTMYDRDRAMFDGVVNEAGDKWESIKNTGTLTKQSNEEYGKYTFVYKYLGYEKGVHSAEYKIIKGKKVVHLSVIKEDRRLWSERVKHNRFVDLLQKYWEE